ncbi:hypothetical protein ACTXT7_002984 [Hymenolepis weldensis]
MDDFHNEGDSDKPCFCYEIPGGLLHKDVIEITGYFYGEKIAIEILAEKYSRNGENTALPLQFTLTKNGKWTTMTYTEGVPRQMQSGNAPAAENFQIRIVALDVSFEIYLNGQQLCTVKHLVSLPQVTHISIDGDAEFTGIEFKDLLSENDGSIRSDYNDFNEPTAEVTPGFIRLSENRRSSNRKPKPPIVVPTHGSFRSKQTLATTREESDTYINAGEDINIIARTAHEPVRASADPNVESFAVSGRSSSGKRDSVMSLSKRKNSGSRESLKASLRDKFHLKRGSKGSIQASGNEYINSLSVEDVWVEEAGPEYSADGSGVFVAVGAASVPNLSSQPEKGKDKKKLGIAGHGKKSHSTSSPPGEENKKPHGGIHFGKGGKKEKEPKPEKEKGTKKSLFGRKSSKHGSNKDISVVGTAVIKPEQSTAIEYANPDLSSEKVTLAAMAVGSKISSSSSSSGSKGSLISHGRGSYDIDGAERKFQIQTGTYQRASGDSVAVEVDEKTKIKLKGDSSIIASNLMVGSAIERGSIESFTYDHPSLNIPLQLEGISKAKTSTNEAVFTASKEEHKKKEKLKGSSPEIADDLFENNRAISSKSGNYTGVQSSKPLTLTQENILSVSGRGITPIIGVKGSYDLEKAPEASTGKHQPRADISWDGEPEITQKMATSNVQHSKPPSVDLVGGAVLVTETSQVNKKEKKHVFKGESSEIASNLFDEEGAKVLRSASLDGYPFCGILGFNMPLKIDASNRDAQPVPYGIASPRYTQRLSGRYSVGGELSIDAHVEHEVNAAAPYSGTYETKSVTLPASSKHGGEDEKDKHRKHRFSGFFKKMFRKKRKSGGSVSEEEFGVAEGVGTDHEMTEYRTSSQQSFDFDEGDTNFTVTASPSEVCLYASQLRGNKPTLKGNTHMRTMCGGGLFQIPLTLTAADIPEDISIAGSRYVFGAVHLRKQRRDSLRSWSSTSPGGSRRIYHLSGKHRPESVSSWSSISPHGTRRHRKRHGKHRSSSMDSISTWSSVTPKGSRHHYRRSAHHRHDSVSSWSSISPYGTHRHRRRGDIKLEMKPQPQTYAVNIVDQPYDSFINIQKQETSEVRASYPERGSTHSSTSSIPSLYGRIVIVGQSPGFRARMQSYRKRMEMKKKKGHNGHDSGSTSSISSIASDRLPPTVVKMRGGEFATFEGAGETIFEQRPQRKEDTYAIRTCLNNQISYSNGTCPYIGKIDGVTEKQPRGFLAPRKDMHWSQELYLIGFLLQLKATDLNMDKNLPEAEYCVFDTPERTLQSSFLSHE